MSNVIGSGAGAAPAKLRTAEVKSLRKLEDHKTIADYGIPHADDQDARR